MSLVIIAAAPDGIVVGADSAVTYKTPGEELSLSDFYKIIPLPSSNEALAIVGDSRIGAPGRETWFNAWLRKFVAEAATNRTMSSLSEELAHALNQESLPNDGNHVVLLTGWVRSQDVDGPFPRALEVSRGRTGESYVVESLLSEPFVKDIVEWRRGDKSKGYPLQFMTAGIPDGYAQWIRDEGIRLHSSLVAAQVPQPDITSVAEYV